MRLFRLTLISFVVLIDGTAAKALAASGNKQVPQIYAYGIAASFNDSIVYITDVQKVDSVWLEKKTKFLVNRDGYSRQLRDYLAESKGEKDRTCVFVYATKIKKIMKKYNKTKQLYFKGKNKMNVRIVDATELSFKPVQAVAYEEKTDK